MKTKFLPIAIAALATVGIAVGLLLAGDINGARNTTMTIDWAFKQSSVGPALPYTVYGHLIGANGVGVPNRIITVNCWSPADRQGVALNSNPTDSTGYWSISSWNDGIECMAKFAGDETFGPSSSATISVTFPKRFPTLVLSSSKSQVTQGESYQLGGKLRTNDGRPTADAWIDVGAYPIQAGYWTFTAWEVGSDGRFIKNEAARASSTRHQATFEGDAEYFGAESNTVTVVVNQ